MNTYRLAVCEDEALTRENIVSLCRDILSENGTDYTIEDYPSAEALEKALESGAHSFDLLILDIEMTGLSGLDLAKRLRMHQDCTSIIFLTGYESYLPEGYKVQAVDFLIKPAKREELAQAIKRDIKLNHKVQTAALKRGNKVLKLSLPLVKYVESSDHHVLIRQKNGNDVFPISLKEVEHLLPRENFAKSHNSYLVNMDYVREIGRTGLILQDGEQLPIGRKYYKTFQEAFIRYLNR